MKRGWRQFRPRVQLRRKVTSHSLVNDVHQRLDALLAETIPTNTQVDPEQLSPAIKEQVGRIGVIPDAAEWFTLLLLRAPSAVRAQQQMDEHPRGFHDRQARLYELIDFNDAYVSTVLALTDADRVGFELLAREEIGRFCKRVGSRSFSDKQYEAITRGLGREVAVYLGAIDQGYTANMTSRSQDALGVDMIIGDPATNKSLNIDCKTASAYHYRLQDLVQQGRLSKHDQKVAESIGYVREVNGHDGQEITVTILRIDPNEVGDIIDFRFTDTSLLGARLKRMFKEI